MKLIGQNSVRIKGGYLKEKEELVRQHTLSAVYDRFFETGRVGAYDCDPMAKHPAHVFWDSDVIKWAEGAAYYLGLEYDSELDGKIQMLCEKMEKNSFSDGYFNSFYAVHPELTRFTNRHHHELYCAGHLFEASAAYYEATGNDRLLRISERYVDCIKRIFIDEKSASFTTPGHEEIEIGLYRLYEVTGNKKYLDMAKHFIDMRGLGIKENKEINNQNHMPVRDMTEAVGHSVRACYLYTAMADVAAECGDRELEAACRKLFDNIRNRKMYVTGGVGSDRQGERFTENYDLPNEYAYAETCAAIALFFFAVRMQRLENNAKYADVAERALYNGILSGLSLDGESFFYTNPLEINSREKGRVRPHLIKDIYPITERVRVFDCSCCPPNIVRFFPSLGRYFYGIEGDTVYVNQYAESELSHDGVKLSLKTDYPRSGDIRVSAFGCGRVALRIPEWCRDFTLNREYEMQNGYAIVEAGEDITLTLSMPVRFVRANPRVKADIGKIAVRRGPVIYCAERRDNPFDIFSFFADSDESASVCGSYGDLPTLEIKGYVYKDGGELYSDGSDYVTEEKTMTLIPYNTFANRGTTDMAVWLRKA